MYKKVFLFSQKYYFEKASRIVETRRSKFDWILPKGYDTGLKIYNRIIKKEVPLIVLNKECIKWYICGPTVYDVPHIGHASCYVRFDIIRRILEDIFNVRPIIALGITDIDDKIIDKARKQNLDYKALSKQYELEFYKQLNKFNVLPPTFVLRVSDHIPEIIDFISVILQNGYAYTTDDGSVYFDTKKAKAYGKLMNLPGENETESTISKGQKSYFDFVLWKGAKPHEPFWDSPWGKGRPGWHIECSTMASKVFGSSIDLHSGGIDLIFPHHENEEAQSCSYHKCSQWVNYWFHAGQLMIDDNKMSKSLKNFITCPEFLKNYSADNLRMLCFISQYRRGLHYSTDSMKLAVEACNNISQFLGDLKAYIKGNGPTGNISENTLMQELEKTKVSILEQLKNDFNTAACYTSLKQLMKITLKMLSEDASATNSRSPATVAAVLHYFDKVLKIFGFQLGSIEQSLTSQNKNELEFLLETTINFRNKVRMEALCCENKILKKNLLEACDSVRGNLQTLGINIKDCSHIQSINDNKGIR